MTVTIVLHPPCGAAWCPTGHSSSCVSEAVQYSEESRTKCIGLTIETRPDYCLGPHLRDMLSYGCTRLEIGLQVGSCSPFPRQPTHLADLADLAEQVQGWGFGAAAFSNLQADCCKCCFGIACSCLCARLCHLLKTGVRNDSPVSSWPPVAAVLEE